MVDIHSHIIPGIDDGAKNMEMTLEMLKNAERYGTKEIVATPHYFAGYYGVPINVVKEKTKDLNNLAKKEGLDIKVHFGQEVYFSENILKYLDNGLVGTINESRYMLIELNMMKFSIEGVTEVLYELQLKGIVPVIAHPERYHMFIKKPSLINEFIEENFLFQLNMGSITGDFGKEAKKTAEIFLKNKIYSFIGSDAHRDKERSPDMTEGVEVLKEMDNNYFDYLNASGKKLLNNEKVEFIGNLIKEDKKLLGLFSKHQY